MSTQNRDPELFFIINSSVTQELGIGISFRFGQTQRIFSYN